MRLICHRFPLLVLALILVAPAQANEREARAILARAIKAQGGEAALIRAQQCRRTDTGTQAVLDRDIPFVSQVTRSLPDRLRLQIELDKKFTTTLVLDGKKGWQSEGGAPSVPLPAARIREMREEAYLWYLTTLVPITKPDIRLSTLPAIKVGGESAVGILVSSRGHADTRMYFLERNGLLARIERKVMEGGREVEKEYLYSNYKTFDGLTLPTKEIVNINKTKFTELTISNYEFPEKLGGGAFTRP